jgi:alpha-1,6-mannosyltransferase
VVALPLVLLLWGDAAPTWSGFANLAGLPLILAYPSTVALALTLCWWAYLWHSFDHARAGRWALVGAWLGVVAIVHPFTAVAAAVGAAAVTLTRLRSLRPLPVLAALTVAAVVVLAWPYSSVIEVALAAGDLDGIHRPLYSGALRTYGPPLLLCLPALVLRLRRDPLDPLVAMAGLALAVVGAGWATGHWALGRMWPVVLIAAQVALAVELTGAVRDRFRVLVGAWTVVTVAACGWGLYLHHDNALAVVRIDVPVTSFADRHAWITGRVGPGDVLLLDLDDDAELWTARDLIGSGVRFVAPPWPDPTLPDTARRHADNREMLAAGTPEDRRRELLARYEVRWVLDSTGTRQWAGALDVVDSPGPARLIRVA